VRGKSKSPRTRVRSRRASDKEVKKLTLPAIGARPRASSCATAAKAVRRTSAHSRSSEGPGCRFASLDRLYLAAGMYDDLAEILRRRIDVVQDTDEQLELSSAAARIFSDGRLR